MENKKCSLSFDISTTNVGLALWNEKGDLIELKHLELKIDRKIPKEDRYIYKANLFRDYIANYGSYVEEEYGYTLDNIFVEAPLSNTPRNINTTAMLLGFNGICCYKIYEELNIIPKLITVYESRKLFCPEFIIRKKVKGKVKEILSFPKGWKGDDKKEYIRQKVANFEPQINWFYTRNNTIKSTSYDMSDAMCVGHSGLMVIGVIDSNEFLIKNKKCLKDLQIKNS